MRIIDILNNGKTTLSFEVFPPKKIENFDTVQQATEEVAALKPSFMSVTYGAGGGTSEFTLNIAKTIPTITVKMAGNALTKTLFLTRRQQLIKPLFEEKFWWSQTSSENQ